MLFQIPSAHHYHFESAPLFFREGPRPALSHNPHCRRVPAFPVRASHPQSPGPVAPSHARVPGPRRGAAPVPCIFDLWKSIPPRVSANGSHVRSSLSSGRAAFSCNCVLDFVVCVTFCPFALIFKICLLEALLDGNCFYYLNFCTGFATRYDCNMTRPKPPPHRRPSQLPLEFPLRPPSSRASGPPGAPADGARPRPLRPQRLARRVPRRPRGAPHPLFPHADPAAQLLHISG